MNRADENGGRRQPTPGRRLQLPAALTLPPALSTPDALEAPVGPPGSRRLDVPPPLILPTALKAPRTPPDRRPAQERPTGGQGSGTVMVNTRGAHVPPPIPAVNVVGPELFGGPSVLDPGAFGAGGPDPYAADASRESSPRRRRASLKYLLPLLLIPLVAALDDNDRRSRRASPSPPPVTAAVSHSSVGMPIPGGRAPVEPIRVVIAASATALPLNEQRRLGDWISTTQNEKTRVRFERNGHVSAPLTAADLKRPVTTTRPPSAGTGWLRSGARHGRHGARLAVGSAHDVQLPGPRLRSATITVSRTDKTTRNAVAAKIARQIMVTSRQADLGTTTS